jgi:excisionase family DNA binding protein
LLVDINGAAKLLSSTPWTVRGLLWARKIPFIKIGKRFLIDPADLRNFIAHEKEGQRAA